MSEAASDVALADLVSSTRLPRFGLAGGLKKQLDRLLSEGRDGQRASTARAQALVHAADVGRRLNLWKESADALSQASKLFTEDGAVLPGSVALYLAAESELFAGGVPAARARCEEAIWLQDKKPMGTSLAEASVFCALGDAAEARALVKKRPTKVDDLWSSWWLSLASAEVLLEMGGIVGAAQALEKVATSFQPAHARSEAFLRLKMLQAATHLAQRMSGESEGDDARLVETLQQLATAARGFPLYQVWERELRAERDLLVGAADAKAFEAVIASADELKAPYLKARLLARQVAAIQCAADAEALQRSKTARDALVELGATKRATDMQQQRRKKDKEDASKVSKMSIQLRLEGGLDELNLTDENGLEAVIEVSRYLSSIRSLDELLKKILESVVRVMRAERGALLALEGDEIRCKAARGMEVEKVVEGSNEISFGVVRETMSLGEAITTDNALADQRFRERASVMATDIRSVVCAPIRTRERTLGFVYLDRRITAVPFNDDHKDLLSAFCTQVAVAWENALAFQEIEDLNAGLERKVEERTKELVDTRLKLAETERDAMEKEMHLARDVQQSILPSEELIDRPRLVIAGKVIPASFCGGDFWGLIELGDKTLVLIADVTGHGMAASLITAVAGACLDTLSETKATDSVSSILSTLNKVVYSSARGRLCATAFCGIFDPATGRMSYANAGHNFPYLLKGGSPEPIVARGVRLGEAPDHTFEEQDVALEAGQRLVLFTDGIVEWENKSGKQFGERRLRKSMSACVDDAADVTITKLIADAEQYTDGTVCDDDLTIVVMDVR